MPEQQKNHDHGEHGKPTAGHWLLAKVGKKVLRPGGRETTQWLLNQIPITGNDLVEFAPGLGITAREILKHKPASYVGVDADQNAATRTLHELKQSSNAPAECRIIHGTAAETGLSSGCADVVIGEAMLTMQTDKHKLEIMKEAARVLRPGGHYAIHELGLTPNDLDPELKTDIQRSLARSIKVNARPLTTQEWIDLTEKAGFKILGVYHAPMALLEPKRMINDEGLLRTGKIVFNIARQAEIRERILGMRKVFRENAKHLDAIALVLERT